MRTYIVVNNYMPKIRDILDQCDLVTLYLYCWCSASQTRTGMLKFVPAPAAVTSYGEKKALVPTIREYPHTCMHAVYPQALEHQAHKHILIVCKY